MKRLLTVGRDETFHAQEVALSQVLLALTDLKVEDAGYVLLTAFGLLPHIDASGAIRLDSAVAAVIVDGLGGDFCWVTAELPTSMPVGRPLHIPADDTDLRTAARRELRFLRVQRRADELRAERGGAGAEGQR